ncbi:hypothetical protein CHARACLAT_032068 [Characodon lateralis]|uniref:Uncharacterized protein n=1 Tax=Characodon lateralis TaxID=208331 RepID=A0ABU7E5K0_9TELE|nr:hypothetical protein [Characodon lateralis]
MTERDKLVESKLIGDLDPLSSPILSYRTQSSELSDSSRTEASANPGTKTGTETIINSCTVFMLLLKALQCLTKLFILLFLMRLLTINQHTVAYDCDVERK